MIKLISQKEFYNLKNKKLLNSEQKKLRSILEDIKVEAINNAKNKLNNGQKISEVMNELADEIKEKNAYHLSKTLSIRMKR